MRRDFVKQMMIEMELNKDIVFLTADLGFNALEGIKEKFPDRFINVGIAEQHLIGMAAGLALEGKKVIAYSIASFSSMRPYEQIRTDVCYQDLDVQIIGAGGGVNECLAAHGVQIPILNIGLPDRFIEHGSREEMLADAGLDKDGISRSVDKFYGSSVSLGKAAVGK